MTLKQCTSLRVTAEDSLQTSSSDTRQLSLLSGMPMPAKSSENEPQKDGSPIYECGKGTSDCSIHPSTPEAWIAFMRDSLAKTLASLESKQAYLREPDQVFTEKSCVSLAWLMKSEENKERNPYQFSWKTYQQSLVTGWEPYLETWPRWGMTLNGYAFVHPMSERRITETDGLHWPTPTCQVGAMYLETNALKRNSMSLASAVHYFPTPMARDWKGHTNNPQARGYGMGLPDYVKQNSEDTGQLNPSWVEWLMGFPIGFTVSKDWVTRKFRSKRQLHGNS